MFTAEQKAFFDGSWRKPWLSIFCLPPFYFNLTDKNSLQREIASWAVEIESLLDIEGDILSIQYYYKYINIASFFCFLKSINVIDNDVFVEYCTKSFVEIRKPELDRYYNSAIYSLIIQALENIQNDSETKQQVIDTLNRSISTVDEANLVVNQDNLFRVCILAIDHYFKTINFLRLRINEQQDDLTKELSFYSEPQSVRFNFTPTREKIEELHQSLTSGFNTAIETSVLSDRSTENRLSTVTLLSSFVHHIPHYANEIEMVIENHFAQT